MLISSLNHMLIKNFLYICYIFGFINQCTYFINVYSVIYCHKSHNMCHLMGNSKNPYRHLLFYNIKQNKKVSIGYNFIFDTPNVSQFILYSIDTLNFLKLKFRLYPLYTFYHLQEAFLM